MAAPPTPAEVQLAQRLRHLRDQVGVTQVQLAKAFSAEQQVGPATVSSWENMRNPATPPTSRLEPYARFFTAGGATEVPPRLVPADDMTAGQIELRDHLLAELTALWDAVSGIDSEAHLVSAARRSWFFDDDGPVTIVCPDAPPQLRGPLWSAQDPNYVQMHAYADLDALVELHGHIRAENLPAYGVFHKLASQVGADDLSSHVVLVGGIAYNDITRVLLRLLTRVPVRQLEDPKVQTGEIFAVGQGDEERRFYPQWAPDDETALLEDVALLARVANPYNTKRTLTICNGVHSRGVLGAVRALTDSRMRSSNEAYLAERFPGGEFAMLLKVPVIGGQTMSPDMQNPASRLYEWPAARGSAKR